jgi:CRISPR/Cas system-associated endonuclease/helicase Cas3
MSSNHLQLRPYQTQAVDALEAHRRAGISTVVLQAPTGSGKTIRDLDFVAPSDEVQRYAKYTLIRYAKSRRAG